MMNEYAKIIATKLGFRIPQVESVLQLFEEGSTIPFIARYRKDLTGGLDEVQILQIQEAAKSQKELDDRKAFVLKSISEQGKLTEYLENKIKATDSLVELEDLYLPYKSKRKTKAQIAKEQGLAPLAELILLQGPADILLEAEAFLNEKITSVEDAIQGAKDIISETINEDLLLRAKLRKLFEEKALFQSKVLSDKETEGIKYKDYFDFAEPIHKIPSHRILAVLRGFLEGFLRLSIAPNEEEALQYIEEAYLKSMSPARIYLAKSCKEAYRRMLQPSLETEFRTALKQKADEEAIQVFAENLKQLLLSAPLGAKKVLAIDPGYRSGCKIACLDAQGSLEKTSLIYIHENGRLFESEQMVRELVNRFQIEAIAIGDGTAGRETEIFIKKLNLNLPVFLVNEDGASVYSASEIAREEFPLEDLTVRGSVSIGRRLMDPLAELVKIDPKSIGVGQYQHDVNPYRLKERLDQTVVSCVNGVGVNLNTASKHLLGYVSGIGPGLAENIVKLRNELGRFTNRTQLLKVPRLGGKAYEQCAGFLRIPAGDHPLDASAVHPEAYPLVDSIAKDLGIPMVDMIANEKLLAAVNPKKYVNEQFGELTIVDILKELKKPGLDPRNALEEFEFANIYKMEEVIPGMIVPGMVTNLTRFGAFIDIGVKQDGLVHVSEIANKYIADPAECLQLGQKLKVKVLEVDLVRKRIALSIKQASDAAAPEMRGDKKFPSKSSNASGGSSAAKPSAGSAIPNELDALAALKLKFAKK